MLPLIILAIENEDDRDFMAGIYLDYNRLIRSEVRKILRDRSHTEDVLQTVLEKLIDKIDTLRGMDREHLVNYIIVAARNNTFNYMRKHMKTPVFSLDEDADAASAYSDLSMRTPIQSWEESADISEAWKKLDGKSRYVLELKYVLAKSNEEIARDLGISPSSVRSSVSRARNKLKALLEKEEIAF